MSRISNFNEFLNETYSDIQGFVIAVMPKTLGDESTEVEDYHPMLISASTKKQGYSNIAFLFVQTVLKTLKAA